MGMASGDNTCVLFYKIPDIAKDYMKFKFTNNMIACLTDFGCFYLDPHTALLHYGLIAVLCDIFNLSLIHSLLTQAI